MAGTIPFTVIEGMRWDTISYLAYGKASLFGAIISANPSVPITTRLKGGTVLQIPVKTDDQIKTNKELAPPWKQDL